MNDSTVLLISCGRRKSSVPCRAKDMYNSCRFHDLKTIAESNCLEWYIMSAKYGLLLPNRIIAPYELRLGDCSAEYRKQWAEKVAEHFSGYSKDSYFIIVADSEYSQHIVPLLVSKGFHVVAPFAQKNEAAISDYIQNATHVNDVVEFYKCMHKLAEDTGGIRLFKECTGKMYWPKRGVYFFVDFNEKSLLSGGAPRIVRIGTHAVSKGSKSTLWQRLKTHKGSSDGGGNHRGSVFRLHVGNAIIKREGLICDSWGVGQNASAEIRNRERGIEQLVSEYIGQLGVIVLDVDDNPSATSMRAFLEKNSIALLTSTNSSFNFSSTRWLGNFSPRIEILDSCLWNINYVASEYNEAFLSVLKQYIEKTVQNFNMKER